MKQLKKQIPLPSKPIDTNDSKLVSITKKLGTEFPSDYLEFSRVYGSGTIYTREGKDNCWAWEVYSAFRPGLNKYIKFFFWQQNEMRKAGYDDKIWTLFPEEEGLLPFAAHDDLYFTWQTIGKPDKWKVVVMWGMQKGEAQKFDYGFSEFWYRFLMKEIKVSGFHKNWKPEKDISFESVVYNCP